MQKGRLVYIDPNDIINESSTFSQAVKTDISTYTWNPEDLNLYVDLQVICADRSDCGEEVDLNTNKYVSLMEGVPLTKNSNRGSLTTSYTDISYTEIHNNNVSNKELLGITSIDITFDAHFYPKVTINFTDVRAYSLFMPQEEAYKEELKTQAYEAGKYHEAGRAYTSFFNSIFKFPYPRFLLTVKGFYGTKVTFILAVETFKSALNSNTGNFDVTISFIGYMYGLYTDIPMNYLMCAPYIEPLGTSSGDELAKSKYWEDNITNGTFLTKQGEKIPTFLEFVKSYNSALQNMGTDAMEIGNSTSLLVSLKDINGKIETIKNSITKLINDIGTDNDAQKATMTINTDEQEKYIFYIFEKSNEQSNVVIKWNTTTAIEIRDIIDKINNDYGDIVKPNGISHSIFTNGIPDNGSVCTAEVLCKATDLFEINIIKNEIKYKTDLTNNKINLKVYKNTENTDFNEYKFEATTYAKDLEVLYNNLENLIQTNKNVNNLYVCAIPIKDYFKKLNEIKETNEKNIKGLVESAGVEAESHLSSLLGFTPSIENIIRMVFAHLQCFLHEFLEETIYKIDGKKSERTLKNFKIKKEETDIVSKDDKGNTFIPPFFAYYKENKEGQKTIAYPGATQNNNLINMDECLLVNRFLKAANSFKESFETAVEELQETTTNTETPVYTVGTYGFKLPISYNNGFHPTTLYDAFYDNTNPYYSIPEDSKTLVQDIYYVFLLRLYGFLMTGGSFSTNRRINKFIDIESLNIKERFGETLTSDKIQAFVELVLGNKPLENGVDIYNKINDYSKNKLMVLENLKVPYNNSYDFNQTLLITTQPDICAQVEEESRKKVLNDNNVSTYKYLKGVNIVESSLYQEFVKIEPEINDRNHEDEEEKITGANIYPTRKKLGDNTNYIKENWNAYQNAIHQIYKFKKEKDRVIGEDIIKLTNVGVNRLPSGDEIKQYCMPVVVFKDEKNVFRNVLYWSADPNINKVTKAFYLIAALVGDIEDIIDCQENHKGLKDFQNLGCEIVLTRKLIPIYYGMMIYLLRKKIVDNEEFVPNLIKIDGENFYFTVYLNEGSSLDDMFNRNNSYVDANRLKNVSLNFTSLTTLIKKAILASYKGTVIKNEDNTTKVIDEKTYANLTISDLKAIFSNINKVETVTEENKYCELERFFINEVNNGLINNALRYAVDEYSLVKEQKIRLIQDESLDNKYKSMKIYPHSGKTSQEVVKLLSECVCMITTNYKLGQNDFKSRSQEMLLLLTNKLKGGVKEEKKQETTNNSGVVEGNNSDYELSLYYTLKNLYDKWVCSYGKMDRFKLSKPEVDFAATDIRYKEGGNGTAMKEINNFIFVDSFYRNIGESFKCNPDMLIEMVQQALDGTSQNFSIYQFIHEFCVKNKLLMRAVPVYNNFYTEEGLKQIFKPHEVFDVNQAQQNGFSSTYIIMYTHQPSSHLNQESGGYVNDGMDLAGTIITTDTLKIFNDSEGFRVPAFAVTYGKQNQNYFKSINVNMDNPMTTDYSIANTLILSNTATNGDLSHPIGIGQNIYSIYSNRSYNCTVEMIGCANIMPMMYFQLNNIPMFKGAYMIVSVKHSIRNGNMTTTFTGVRASSILYPFVNQSLILNTLLSRINKSGKEKNGDSREISNGGIKYSVPVTMLTNTVTNLKIENASLLEKGWKIIGTSKYPLTQTSNRKIDKIILHYTAGASSAPGNGAKCRDTWLALWNNNGKKASADFAVDDGGAAQFNPDLSKFYALSAKGNSTGISIEMCSTWSKKSGLACGKTPPNAPQWTFTDAVIENTKLLCLELFKSVGGKLDITTHYHMTQKPCPGIWGWNPAVWHNENGLSNGMNNESELEKFKQDVYARWDALSKT